MTTAIKYQASKGTRVNYGFLGVGVTGLAYSPELRIWGTWSELYDMGVGGMSEYPCRTVRAFRRFVRKHPQFHGNMTLLSRWIGHNVYA